MDFFLPINIPQAAVKIRHQHRIVLLGSCFTEHMSSRLAQHGFQICSNPQGILFNPISTAQAVENIVSNRQWTKEDLFELNGLYNSWQHHSRFSNTRIETALLDMNTAMQDANNVFKEANWLIITLGTAYQYELRSSGMTVANNHRAPSQWFEKQLLTTQDIIQVWHKTLEKLYVFNPDLKVIFTVSPVRHARDGVVANNRSKGRLLDAVHTVCETFPDHVFYFPAYELVVDVLRDYRFYDIDLVHPNHAATRYVWEQFVKYRIHEGDLPAMQMAAELHLARSHQPRFPDTDVHKKFRLQMLLKAQNLQKAHPWMNLHEIISFFEDAENAAKI